MRRLLLVVSWGLAGHTLAGAAYWALLHVPESSAWMLALSAALAIAVLTLWAVVQVGAVLGWASPQRPVRGLLTAPRRAHHVVPALLVLALGWSLIDTIAAALAASRGSIDAALMARFGWAETAWVHLAADYLLFAVRCGVLLPLAVALLAAAVLEGWAGIRSLAWARQGLRPRTMILTLAAVIVCIVLPWHHVYWRPGGLSPTSMELVFVSVKLGAIALLMAVGWALVIRLGVPAPPAVPQAAAPSSPA